MESSEVDVTASLVSDSGGREVGEAVDFGDGGSHVWQSGEGNEVKSIWKVMPFLLAITV